MRRRNLLVGVPATLIVRPPANHPPAAHPPGAPVWSLSVGQATGAITLDPAHGSFTLNPGASQVALCLYDGLLGFDPAMRLVPLLASSYAMAANLMSCVLKLRPHVLFQDGTPVDAAAVKRNLERVMSPQRNPTNREIWDRLAAVETPDDGTVIIHTSVPYRDLPNVLAHPSAGLVSPAAIDTFGETGIATNPVGAGPYRLSSFDQGYRVVLDAFPGYWGGRPKAAHLIFDTIFQVTDRVQALRTNKVQVIDGLSPSVAQGLEGVPEIKVTAVPGLRTLGFAINMTRPPLANQRVREALTLAAPVEAIAAKLFRGYASVPDSPLAFAATGYVPISRQTYDPQRAMEMLEAEGYWPQLPLQLAMLTSDGLFPSDAEIADMVAAALRQVGVAVTVTKIRGDGYWNAVRQGRATTRWDVALLGFEPANASGLHHLNAVFRANADDATVPDAWNIGRYRNKQVDALLDQAGHTADPGESQAALARAQELIWQDAPMIWLPVVDHIVALRANVSGVDLSPSGFALLRHAV